MKPLVVQPKTKERLKGWVLEELRRRQSHYRTAMENRHALRLVRFGRNKINLPPLIREIVPQNMIPRINLAYIMGEVVQGALASKRPRVIVNPRSDGDKDSAQRRQAWLGMKDQTMERQARRPIFWKLLDNLVNDGWGFKKTWWRPWYEFPQKEEGIEHSVYNREVTKFLEEKAAWPIAQRTVDPLTTYPRIGEYGGGDMIEYGTRPAQSTLTALGLKITTGGKLTAIPKEAAFPQWELPSGTSPNLRIGEFWNDEIMAIIVGSDVFLFENEMGKLPYTFRPGYTTGLYDPALEGMSAIWPTLTMQPWIDTYFGVMTGWALLAAIWPTYLTKDNVQGANPTTEGPEISDISFGKIVKLPPGTRVQPTPTPPVGGDLREMMSFLIGTTDRFTPPILQGLAPGRIAGVAASALREAALGRLASLIDNTEQLLEEDDAFCLYLVDQVIGATVYAEGWEFEESTSGRRRKGDRIGISPRDIQGRYTTLRELNTESLQDVIAKGTHGVFMKQGGVWSGERSSKFSGVDDWRAEKIQMLREFLFDQLAPQYAMQEAAAEQPSLEDLLQQFLSGGEEGEAPPEGSPTNGASANGASGNVPGPVPRRGGRPTGSPKMPGGTRPVGQARGRMTPQ